MPELVGPAVEPGRLRHHAQPELRVDELTLRPWRERDTDAVIQAYRDPDIQRWHVRTMTADEAVTWIRSWGERWDAETGAGWAVVEPGSADAGPDTVVGRVGLRTLDLAAGSGEVSYWVPPAHRGRAIAARTVDVMSRWLFTEVGLHRLELEHALTNMASCRAAHRAGFATEGTKRRSVRHADGWHDMHLHARLGMDEVTPIPTRSRQ